MTYEWKWRSTEPAPQDFTPEKFAARLRKFLELDNALASRPPPPICVSRETFSECVRLGFIDESGKRLPWEPTV